MVSFFVFGCSINFIRSFASDRSSTDYYSSAAAIALSLVFLLIATLFEAFLTKRSQAKSMPISVILYSSVALVLIFFDNSYDMLSVSLVMASFFIYVIILYQSIADYSIKSSVSYVFIAATCFASNSLGLFLGALVDKALAYATTDVYAACLSATYVLFFIGFILLGASTRPVEETGTQANQINLGNSEKSFGEIIAINCGLMTQGKAFTKKESEVLEELVSGKNVQTIADEQGVSVNTIKTHMAHVYQKLDIHSREELMTSFMYADKERTKSKDGICEANGEVQ